MTGTDAKRQPVVLVVEDDPSLRELITRLLSVDLCVRGVGSAEEALASMRRDHPDVIVCDLILPGTSGEAFIERVRSDARFDSTPLIVITGLHDDGVRLRLLQSGANDFIEKPFRLAELRARVHNVLTPALRCADLRARNDELSRRAAQLQTALESRIAIEQAKAFIAAERDIDLFEAFELLRARARSQRASIRSVASEVIRLRGLGERV